MPTVGTVQYLTCCECAYQLLPTAPRGTSSWTPSRAGAASFLHLAMHSMWAALGRGRPREHCPKLLHASLPREAHCACGVPSCGRLQAAVRGAGLPRRAVGITGGCLDRTERPEAPGHALGCRGVGTLRRGRHRDSPPAPPQLPGTHVPYQNWNIATETNASQWFVWCEVTLMLFSCENNNVQCSLNGQR